MKWCFFTRSGGSFYRDACAVLSSGGVPVHTCQPLAETVDEAFRACGGAIEPHLFNHGATAGKVHVLLAGDEMLRGISGSNPIRSTLILFIEQARMACPPRPSSFCAVRVGIHAFSGVSLFNSRTQSLECVPLACALAEQCGILQRIEARNAFDDFLDLNFGERGVTSSGEVEVRSVAEWDELVSELFHSRSFLEPAASLSMLVTLSMVEGPRKASLDEKSVVCFWLVADRHLLNFARLVQEHQVFQVDSCAADSSTPCVAGCFVAPSPSNETLFVDFMRSFITYSKTQPQLPQEWNREEPTPQKQEAAQRLIPTPLQAADTPAPIVPPVDTSEVGVARKELAALGKIHDALESKLALVMNSLSTEKQSLELTVNEIMLAQAQLTDARKECTELVDESSLLKERVSSLESQRSTLGEEQQQKERVATTVLADRQKAQSAANATLRAAHDAYNELMDTLQTKRAQSVQDYRVKTDECVKEADTRLQQLEEATCRKAEVVQQRIQQTEEAKKQIEKKWSEANSALIAANEQVTLKERDYNELQSEAVAIEEKGGLKDAVLPKLEEQRLLGEINGLEEILRRTSASIAEMRRSLHEKELTLKEAAATCKDHVGTLAAKVCHGYDTLLSVEAVVMEQHGRGRIFADEQAARSLLHFNELECWDFVLQRQEKQMHKATHEALNAERQALLDSAGSAESHLAKQLNAVESFRCKLRDLDKEHKETVRIHFQQLEHLKCEEAELLREGGARELSEQLSVIEEGVSRVRSCLGRVVLRPTKNSESSLSGSARLDRSRVPATTLSPTEAVQLLSELVRETTSLKEHLHQETDQLQRKVEQAERAMEERSNVLSSVADAIEILQRQKAAQEAQIETQKQQYDELCEQEVRLTKQLEEEFALAQDCGARRVAEAQERYRALQQEAAHLQQLLARTEGELRELRAKREHARIRCSPSCQSSMELQLRAQQRKREQLQAQLAREMALSGEDVAT